MWVPTAGPSDPDDEIGYVDIDRASNLEAVQVTGISGATWRIKVDGNFLLKGSYATKADAIAGIQTRLVEP